MQFSALLGNPVEHSISPIVFGWFAEQVGIEYAHLKILVRDATSLQTSMDHLSALGCAGANITLPYKRTVLEFLDEVDDDARMLGAVNAVIFRNGRKKGFNTDVHGARYAIEKQLRPIIHQDQAVIIGSGGVSRAICFALLKKTPNVTILAKNTNEAEQIKADYERAGLSAPQLRELSEQTIIEELVRADILINATPLGMYPDNDTSPVSDAAFERASNMKAGRKWFAFDAVFNPENTLFLRKASDYGAQTCSGLWMMIYQCQEAFKLWTGIEVSESSFETLFANLRQQLIKRYASTTHHHHEL
jgi:shikimate dehydrogenase